MAGFQSIQIIDSIFHPLFNLKDLLCRINIDPSCFRKLQRGCAAVKQRHADFLLDFFDAGA